MGEFVLCAVQTNGLIRHIWAPTNIFSPTT